MAKLSAKGYDLWAFFNASTENLLVLTGFFRFRVSTKFLGQVDVLDGQQTQIHGFVTMDFFLKTFTQRGIATSFYNAPKCSIARFIRNFLFYL